MGRPATGQIRESSIHSVLAGIALLSAARADGSDRVRAWVAACATGEEPYTLAILAAEAFGVEDPPVSFTGTDLSAAALLRADHSHYGRRSIRHLDDRRRRRWFDSVGDGLAVVQPLRDIIEFRRHNLVRDHPPGQCFDLIVCRNVLIYFNAATVRQVVGSLEAALAPGGTLLLGAADRLCSPAPPSTAALALEPRAEPAPRRPLHRPAWRGERRAPPKLAENDAPGPTARISAALAAADAGKVDEAIDLATELLEQDPLDSDAQFVRGVAQLQRGDARAAVDSLRRALYVDPAFALAAFKLGRAQEELGDAAAARRAYGQALRALAPGHTGHERLAAGIDLADVAAACGARIVALSPGG